MYSVRVRKFDKISVWPICRIIVGNCSLAFWRCS